MKTQDRIYELGVIHSTQASFYGKARVIERGNRIVLRSYSTEVCELDANTLEIKKIGYYSPTTQRHINEFLMQHGHEKMTKKQVDELEQKLEDEEND